jgi:sugar lactone lactonase YvrE
MLAMGAHDTLAAFYGLRDYARLGLGRDLSADSALADFTKTRRFDDIRRDHAANLRPLVRSRILLSFGDSTFWAEGVDRDPVTKHFYVTSIRHRTIADVAPDGSVRELWPRDQPQFGAIFSVRVDTGRHVLWATTSGVPQTEGYLPGDSAIAGLLEIRPRDGAVLRRWNVPPEHGGHVLGDLAIGPAGDVFVTDSNQPVLYWLHPNGDSLESMASPLFHSLQGLAPTPDGRALYLTDYSHGLLRVDLTTRAITRVDDAPNSTSLGCDGIVWDGDGIIAVQNGVTPARIVRFTLDRSGKRVARLDVIDRNWKVADEPTIGTLMGREFVYVANGQWNKHDDDGKRLAGTTLTPTILLAVPLGRYARSSNAPRVHVSRFEMLATAGTPITCRGFQRARCALVDPTPVHDRVRRRFFANELNHHRTAGTRCKLERDRARSGLAYFEDGRVLELLRKAAEVRKASGRWSRRQFARRKVRVEKADEHTVGACPHGDDEGSGAAGRRRVGKHNAK